MVRARRHGHAGRAHRNGAVVAAGSVATGDVPVHGIIGGNPARLIRTRYAPEDVARLLAVAWWDWPAQHLTERVRTIMSGSIDHLEAAAAQIDGR